jgi:hypothetical protein
VSIEHCNAGNDLRRTSTVGDQLQESREEVAVAVTPREKLRIRLVAAKHGTDLSNPVRDRILSGILEEAADIRANWSP